MSLSAAFIKEAVIRHLKSLYGWSFSEYSLTIDNLSKTEEGYSVDGAFSTGEGKFSFTMKVDPKGDIVTFKRTPETKTLLRS